MGPRTKTASHTDHERNIAHILIVVILTQRHRGVTIQCGRKVAGDGLGARFPSVAGPAKVKRIRKALFSEFTGVPEVHYGLLGILG